MVSLDGIWSVGGGRVDSGFVLRSIFVIFVFLVILRVEFFWLVLWLVMC